MNNSPWTSFVACIVYLSLLGIISFFLGRILRKDHFDFEHFPYRPYRWERDGAIYDGLGIRRWKDKVPDMSRIVPSMIPSKRLPKNLSASQLYVMLQETCVAEFIHVLLCIAGLRCLSLWRGIGGILVTLFYILFGNVPFILIQRYNRPKLARLYRRLYSRELKEVTA